MQRTVVFSVAVLLALLMATREGRTGAQSVPALHAIPPQLAAKLATTRLATPKGPDQELSGDARAGDKATGRKSFGSEPTGQESAAEERMAVAEKGDDPAAVDLRLIRHRVRAGDNWDRVAARYGVSRAELVRWNGHLEHAFAIGQQLDIWLKGEAPRLRAGGLLLDVDPAGLPLVPVQEGARSLGEPSRGRLRRGVQVPENPDLYTLRRPEFTFGSTHAVRHLQLALAKFKLHSDYARPVLVSDMSRRRGRAFGHHNSHQSGRDVDIWLPTLASVPDGEPAARASEVDWDATWELTEALIRTGEVQFIFLSRSRQRHLYRAAKRHGITREQLQLLMQFPRRIRHGIIRHAPGHHKHMHVRFHCGPQERRCR